MQYFHYHPILGLQYFSEKEYLILDITVIPQDFSLSKMIKLIKQQGICIIDSAKSAIPVTRKLNNIIHNLYGKD